MPRRSPNPETHYTHRPPGQTYTRQSGELTPEQEEKLAAEGRAGPESEEDTSLILTEVEPKKR